MRNRLRNDVSIKEKSIVNEQKSSSVLGGLKTLR